MSRPYEPLTDLWICGAPECLYTGPAAEMRQEDGGFLCPRHRPAPRRDEECECEYITHAEICRNPKRSRVLTLYGWFTVCRSCFEQGHVRQVGT